MPNLKSVGAGQSDLHEEPADSNPLFGWEGWPQPPIYPNRKAGVVGGSDTGYGVVGASGGYDGVKGISNSSGHAGVSAVNESGGGFGVWASANGNGTGIYAHGNPAGYFEGDVHVTGDVILDNADVAEDFDLEDDPTNADPGTVLVIGPSGALCTTDVAYDSRLAGVVSGAGDLRPGVVLHRVATKRPRSPIALMGKVCCKVDASYGAIRPGDLLTTSPTLGHAMRVAEPARAMGAVLGKALEARDAGRGLVRVFVTMR